MVSMMELVVGPVLDESVPEAAQAWVSRCLGAANSGDWNADVKEERIPVPDFGAVMALRDHASELEGLKGIEETLARTRFGHLPLRPWHLWLPIDFAQSRFPLIDMKIGPICLGSAIRLKGELDEIRRIGKERGIAPSTRVVEVMTLLGDAADKAILRKTPLRGFAG